MVIKGDSHIIKSRLKYTSKRTDSVYLLGCINDRGFVSLELIEGTLNADAYNNILDLRVASKMRTSQVRATWAYQHDNVPAHKTK